MIAASMIGLGVLKKQTIQEQQKIRSAKDAFFLDGNDFTLADIKSRKRKLMRSFHPDNGENEFFSQKINEYYEILEAHVKNRKEDGRKR
jgi:hypothetical protein